GGLLLLLLPLHQGDVSRRPHRRQQAARALTGVAVRARRRGDWHHRSRRLSATSNRARAGAHGRNCFVGRVHAAVIFYLYYFLAAISVWIGIKSLLGGFRFAD